MSEDTTNLPPESEPAKEQPPRIAISEAPIFSDKVSEEEKRPFLRMPNHTPAELEALTDQFLESIRSKTEARTTEITNKTNENYVVVDIGERTQNGEPIPAIMTQEEARAYYHLMESIDYLNQMPMNPTAKDSWTNAPRAGGNVVAIGSLGQPDKTDPSSYLRDKLGIGQGKYIPLHGSGFSIQIATPGTLDQLFFQAQLGAEKIEQTRQSTGFSLTTPAAYITQEFTNWVLKYVTKSTAGTIDPVKLKQMISCLDVDPIALGISSAIWSKGYPFERYCYPREEKDAEGTVTVKGCTHTHKMNLDVNRMMVVRYDRLTENQLMQVSKRSGLIDEKTLAAYRQGLRPEVSRVRDVGHGICIILRIPTIYQAERVCTSWLDRVTARSKNINVGGNTREAREAFLLRANVVGRLMSYGHYIEAIGTRESPEDEPTILFSRANVTPSDEAISYNADEKMDNELESMSANEEVCDTIIKQVISFIEDMTVTWTVLPKSKCPKCGEGYDHDKDNELKHDHLISVSALELFTALLDRKIHTSGG